MKSNAKFMLRTLLCVAMISFFNVGIALSLPGTYKANGITKDIFLETGYANWGDDEEPEWAWNVSVWLSDSDEAVEMYWFSENTHWGYFDRVRFFGPSTLELAEVNDGYVLFMDNSGSRFLEIGTYGCRTTDGEFFPQYLLIREFKDNVAVNNIWMAYSESYKKTLYGAVREAISSLGMTETVLNILPND